MKRLLNLIVVALIFAAVAGGLSQYVLGTSVATISAQDDHDEGVGGADDGGGHVDLLSDTSTFEYLEGDSGLAMYEGIVFDPAKDMDAMRAAGLFAGGIDPVKTGVGAPSDPIAGYFDPSTGGVFDSGEVQYYDPGTGLFHDEHSVQFFDPETGVLVDRDSADFSEGGLVFEFRSDEALAAYDQAANLAPGDFLQHGGDFSFGLAQDLDFRGFQDLGSDAVSSMLEAMGHDQFLSLEGGRIAGMFGAMDNHQITGFDPGEILDAVQAMQGEHFQHMDAIAPTPW